MSGQPRQKCCEICKNPIPKNRRKYCKEECRLEMARVRNTSKEAQKKKKVQYYEYVENDKCTICGEKTDRLGKPQCCRNERGESPSLLYCLSCLLAMYESRKLFQDNRRQQNRCTLCNAPIQKNNYILCLVCRNNIREYEIKIKKEVFTAYANKCHCCEECVFDFLSMDHINGRIRNGIKDIRKGHRLYSWLKQNNFPKNNFQLLCYNCNCGKSNNKICPHKISFIETSWWKYKLKIYSNYSDYCVCCGEEDIRFLTLDHIEENGSAHRKELKKQKTTIYGWLVKNNFPEGFQILCYNCNTGKSLNSGICPHKKSKNFV